MGIIFITLTRLLATHQTLKKTQQHLHASRSSLKHFLRHNSYKKLNAQKTLPPFLRGLSQTLRAGYSFPQSLAFVAQETPQPLRQSLEEILQEQALHGSMDEGLRRFAQKNPDPEVQFFVQSTNILQKTGGNLVLLFQRLAHLIEERQKLARDLRTFTAQGRLSGVLIAGLWPISLLFFHWLSPVHLKLLLHTPSGHIMLAISILLEVLGGLWIWKIIHPKTT